MLNAGHTAAWISEAFQALLWLFTFSRVKTKPVCAAWLMTHAAPLAHWLREVLWRFELKWFPRSAAALHWLCGVWFIMWSLFSHFLCWVPAFWLMFSSVCYEFTETSLQWWLSSLRGSAGSVFLFYKQMKSQTLTLAECGVLDPADGINVVIVIPVQKAQLHL